MNHEQEHSSHLTTEQLLDYLEQRLAPDEVNYVESHLVSDCTICHAELNWLEQTLKLMIPDPWIDPPQHLKIATRRLFLEHRRAQSRMPSFGERLRSLWPQPRPLAVAFAATLALIIVGALVFQIWFRQLNSPTTELASIEGTVEVQQAGSGEWQAANEDSSLDTGDQIRTGEDSSFTLSYPDDSKTLVAPNTELTILRVSSRPDGTSQVVILRQTLGTTNNTVQPQNSPTSRFEIQTPAATVTVRGTEFSVDVDEDGVTGVFVDEGIVEVAAQGMTVALHAGESTTVVPGSQPEAIGTAPANLQPTQMATRATGLGPTPEAPEDQSVIEATATPTPRSVPGTATPTPASATKTPAATQTANAMPTKNTTPVATETQTSQTSPTDTAEAPTTPKPEPTDTPKPEPTNTPKPEPTNTPKPEPTDTPKPEPTNTPKPPDPTDTPPPKPTDPPEPPPTEPPPPPSPTPEPPPPTKVPPGQTKTPQPPGQTRTPDAKSDKK